MIKDLEGNRISPKRKAKELVLAHLDDVMISFFEDRDARFFPDMTKLEIVRLEDSLKSLVDSIIKKHRLNNEETD